MLCDVFIDNDLQIHPDEVEDDEEVLLVWDFDVDNLLLSLTAFQSAVKAKIPSSMTSILSMPYLDLQRVKCNCGMPSHQGKVLLAFPTSKETQTASPSLQKLSLTDKSEEEDDTEEEMEQEEETELEEEEQIL